MKLFDDIKLLVYGNKLKEKGFNWKRKEKNNHVTPQLDFGGTGHN